MYVPRAPTNWSPQPLQHHPCLHTNRFLKRMLKPKSGPGTAEFCDDSAEVPQPGRWQPASGKRACVCVRVSCGVEADPFLRKNIRIKSPYYHEIKILQQCGYHAKAPVPIPQGSWQ